MSLPLLRLTLKLTAHNNLAHSSKDQFPIHLCLLPDPENSYSDKKGFSSHCGEDHISLGKMEVTCKYRRTEKTKHGWMEHVEVVVKEEEGLFVLLCGSSGGQGGEEKAGRYGEDGTGEDKRWGTDGICVHLTRRKRVRRGPHHTQSHKYNTAIYDFHKTECASMYIDTSALQLPPTTPSLQASSEFQCTVSVVGGWAVVLWMGLLHILHTRLLSPGELNAPSADLHHSMLHWISFNQCFDQRGSAHTQIPYYWIHSLSFRPNFVLFAPGGLPILKLCFQKNPTVCSFLVPACLICAELILSDLYYCVSAIWNS